MAITKEGNRTYGSIEDLEEVDTLSSGDYFVIQTKVGTNLAKFGTLEIPDNQFSFLETYQEVEDDYKKNMLSVKSTLGSGSIEVDNSENVIGALNNLNVIDNDYYVELVNKISLVNSILSNNLNL